MEENINPGREVWVVERDKDGNACEVSGYVFLAKVAHAVILTPYVNDLEDLKGILDYHIEETWSNYDTDLVVLPAADCHLTKYGANSAFKEEQQERD